MRSIGRVGESDASPAPDNTADLSRLPHPGRCAAFPSP